MEPNDKKNSLVKLCNPHTENQSNVISPSEMILNLIQVVGTFEDIKRRQSMFHIMNLVNGYGDIDSVSISSGSLAEGLDIKGSDAKISPLFLNTSQQCLLMLPLYLKKTKQLFWLILIRNSQDLP